jgi:hypothetical protein
MDSGENITGTTKEKKILYIANLPAGQFTGD